MNRTNWKAILAIGVGSVAGAFSREFVEYLLAVPAQGSLTSSFVITAIGGLLIGALMGWVAAHIVAGATTWRPIAVIALIAALATFGASAVVGISQRPATDTDRFLYLTMAHIGTAILTAALARFIVQRICGRFVKVGQTVPRD